mmetsp:Transcript_2324/g.6275  ORF Transcript_2324/g.6275 Transcript_2324/m.6275 type:complete len:209 (-) Transcript_2324:496-1122(-)
MPRRGPAALRRSDAHDTHSRVVAAQKRDQSLEPRREAGLPRRSEARESDVVVRRVLRPAHVQQQRCSRKRGDHATRRKRAGGGDARRPAWRAHDARRAGYHQDARHACAPCRQRDVRAAERQPARRRRCRRHTAAKRACAWCRAQQVPAPRRRCRRRRTTRHGGTCADAWRIPEAGRRRTHAAPSPPTPPTPPPRRRRRACGCRGRKR